MAFESVSVICQYKVEVDEPMFDVLIEESIHESFSSLASVEQALDKLGL